MTPRFDIVAGSRTYVSDLESGYHNVLAMKIINIYVAYNISKLVIQITIYISAKKIECILNCTLF